MDTGHFLGAIESGFELVGVGSLVAGSVIALLQFASVLRRREARTTPYRTLREGTGRAIMVGLEFLVAADIIRSVALDPTFQSVGVLGLIVVVRTALSWSLDVEINGVWPWRRRAYAAANGDREELGEL